MKTNLPRASVAAALLCVASLVSNAQNIPGQPSVNRNLDRLTLLPGPYLLSPARTTPTMMPSPIKLGAAPLFHFTLSPVSASSQAPGVSVPGRMVASPRGASALPAPESLRFDATLTPPPSVPRLEFKASPPQPQNRQ